MSPFQWDEENIGHIQRHGVTPEEAEQIFGNTPVEIGQQFEQSEERFLEVGETNMSRVLSVVYVWRGEQIRILTAFPAKKAFIDYYFAEKSRLYGPIAQATDV